MKIKTFSRYLTIILTFGFFWAKPALAICPICTFAVGAGIGLSRYFKVDDIISGLWIGAIVISFSLWTLSWLDKKAIKIRLQKLLVYLFWYVITIGPLFFMDIFGHPLNKFLGIDRLIFGIILGSFLFFIGANIHFAIKKKQGKVLFPFQKVVFSILPLILATLIFYFLNNGK